MKTLVIVLMLAATSGAELYEYDGPVRRGLHFYSQFENGGPSVRVGMSRQTASVSVDLSPDGSQVTLARWGMGIPGFEGHRIGFGLNDGNRDRFVWLEFDALSISANNADTWSTIASSRGRDMREAMVPIDTPGDESFLLTGHYTILDMDDAFNRDAEPMPFSCLFESTTETAFPDYISYMYSSRPGAIELTIGEAEFFATEPLASPVLDGEVTPLWITSIYVSWTQMTAVVGGSPGMLGDVNWDFSVNGHDIPPFTHELLDGPYNQMADMNQDGQLNGLDVDLFVAAVLSGGNTLHAIPEPSGVILVSLAVLLLALHRNPT